MESILNRRYGRLIVIKELGRIDGAQRVLCLCKCGTKKILLRTNLGKHANSCGCLKKELHTKHGLCDSPEHRAWNGMKARCYNNKSISYHNYGGRGIKVCKRWLNSFINFYRDMGKRPSANHSLERKDNNGNYEPSNCYWATKVEQDNNKRSNHLVTFNGKTQTIAQWSREVNIPYKILSGRFNSVNTWEPKEALTVPVRRKSTKTPSIL